ncbi:glycosyltransferase [Candidatus Dependentiae bacterium]|nr:MAG: glycosyltransferase [Candidatus Dependentiae bacterium]
MSKKLDNHKSIRLVHLISSLNIGGAEAMLVGLVDCLRNKDFQQYVLYFHNGPNVDRIRALGIPVYQVKGFICLYDPIFFFRLFFLLRRLKPDCLHTLLWAANFAGRIIARILGIPVIAALHNNIDQNGRIRIWLDRLTISGANKIIAVSEGVKQSLLQYIPSKRIPEIEVIPNGIEAMSCRERGLQFCKKREEIGFSGHHFIIGSVGRFVNIKNYPLLIEQIPSLLGDYPHIRVVLIGTGPQEWYLTQKIKALDLEGYVRIINDTCALSYYPLFDCFILPSYKEGISMALLEAMSFELPCVVGSYIPEHAVIKANKNGFIVTPKQSFGQIIRRLLEQPKLRQCLGNQAHITVQKNFSRATMVDSYVRLFRSYV